MKKLIAIFSVLLILMCFGLTACGSDEFDEGYNTCIATLKDKLYDGDSLKVSSAEGVNEDSGEYIFYKIHYNAKNAYGAYSGYDNIYLAFEKSSKKVLQADESTFNLRLSLAQSGAEGYSYKKLV